MERQKTYERQRMLTIISAAVAIALLVVAIALVMMVV